MSSINSLLAKSFGYQHSLSSWRRSKISSNFAFLMIFRIQKRRKTREIDSFPYFSDFFFASTKQPLVFHHQREDRYWRSELCFGPPQRSLNIRLEWVNIDHRLSCVHALAGPTQTFDWGKFFGFWFSGEAFTKLWLTFRVRSSCQWFRKLKFSAWFFWRTNKWNNFWCTCAMTNWVSGHDEIRELSTMFFMLNGNSYESENVSAPDSTWK
jgi:hypothetical protein